VNKIYYFIKALKFAEDDQRESRSGDSLIGYSWRRFLEEEGKNPEMLVLLPMVKAAVLAMNATSEIVQQKNCGVLLNRYECRNRPLDRWILTGFSKRGWTAWLAAAVDYRRVKGKNYKYFLIFYTS
jgi:PhoPQ-activated pathogenicity-related protein